MVDDGVDGLELSRPDDEEFCVVNGPMPRESDDLLLPFLRRKDWDPSDGLDGFPSTGVVLREELRE
jgi:hypothetical protein